MLDFDRFVRKMFTNSMVLFSGFLEKKFVEKRRIHKYTI